jgi:hypothetical protein
MYVTGYRENLAIGNGAIVLLPGDSDDFKIDQPIEDTAVSRLLRKFTRLEVFSARNMDCATIDTHGPTLFEFERPIVPRNTR